MTQPPRIARFYLYGDLRRRVEAGRYPLLNTLHDVLKARGIQVELCGDSATDLAAARAFPGYGLVRMIAPPNPRALTFRKTYLEPFFHIEQSAERWSWPVARAGFDPAQVPAEKARRFRDSFRHRLFPDATIRREGFVYLPLQGRLSERRSFQTCTPLEMIERLLEHEQTRPVVATLHPRETYSETDLGALGKLAQHPRLSVQTGGPARWLPACDYVVTQNSSVAFSGYFLNKPAVLFADVDFHHIAANVRDIGAAEAIRMAPEMRPDFAAYLWWFLRAQSIHTGRSDAPERIHAVLDRAGWPALEWCGTGQASVSRLT